MRIPQQIHNNAGYTFGLQFQIKRETTHEIRYNISDIEYKNSFIPKPAMRSEYKSLFLHQGLLMHGLHGMYFIVAM